MGGIELSGIAAGGGTNVDFAQAGLELKVTLDYCACSECSCVSLLQVSFHKDRPVERINAHTLSGGEKSVVTMLFLLTLQQVCFLALALTPRVNLRFALMAAVVCCALLHDPALQFARCPFRCVDEINQVR